MSFNINYSILETLPLNIWPLAEIKHYLKIAHDEDDIMLERLAKSAVEFAEKFASLTITAQKVLASLDKIPKKFAPKHRYVNKIIRVTQIDKVEAKKKDITENYGAFDKEANCFSFDKESQKFGVEIEYWAGYKTLPSMLKQGLMMHVAMMYENETEINSAIFQRIKELYSSYRLIKI